MSTPPIDLESERMAPEAEAEVDRIFTGFPSFLGASGKAFLVATVALAWLSGWLGPPPVQLGPTVHRFAPYGAALCGFLGALFYWALRNWDRDAATSFYRQGVRMPAEPQD